MGLLSQKTDRFTLCLPLHQLNIIGKYNYSTLSFFSCANLRYKQRRTESLRLKTQYCQQNPNIKLSPFTSALTPSSAYTKKMGPKPHFSFIYLGQLLNQYLFSLNYTVSVNSNNNVDTLYRSRNCSTCWCEVRNCNYLCTLSNEVIDRCLVVNLSQVPL